jgi:tetratricopeptide (TPR) repeat protein
LISGLFPRHRRLRNCGAQPLFFSFGDARLRNGCRVLLYVAVVSCGMFCAQAWAQHQSTSKQGSENDSADFAAAETLLHQGSIAEARQKIREQLLAHPSSVAGYNLLGIAYSSEKDYGNALEAFRHALQLNPTSTRTHNNLGNLYIAENRPDLAEKEFETVLRLDPANADGNYNLGLLLMAKGEPAAAIPHLQRVRPQNLETQFNLVRCDFLAKRTSAGLALARELSAAHKSDVRLHFTLGVFLVSVKQYKEATFELEKADALQPETYEILYNLGQAYLAELDDAKAELVLTRALRLKPDSPQALYVLAEVDTEQSKAVDALDLLARAHKLAPENTEIILLLARVSMSQNYFEDAIPLLESGLKLAPQRVDLQAALGESYFMAGKADAAIEQFNKLIALDPSARSYAFLGLSYRRLGRFDEARRYFQEGLKHDSKNATCLFNLAYMDERQGDEVSADTLFRETLRYKPDFPEAMLELANLRIAGKKYAEAEQLLRRYVKSSPNPSTGYYKLAMVERNLHQNQAAERDLRVFQTLAKDAPTGPFPYQHLFDYLDNRSELAPLARTELDVTELNNQIQKHPDQPQDLYLLAEAYLKLGKIEEARKAVAELDRLSAGDYRTQTGVGVLLAHFHMYDDAIEHFQAASRANPDSDDIKFDLADAYFRRGRYAPALATAQSVSEAGQRDDAYLSLLGDIYVHLGESEKAAEIFRDAISRNPDNDQYYLSLALVELRQGDAASSGAVLRRGLERIPSSGKMLWGLGLVAVLEGKSDEAEQRFERAVELLPEWVGSYSTLGVFYYETGQIDKAREVLDRFKGSNSSGLDVSRIESALSEASTSSTSSPVPLSTEARQQLLQLALVLADRTL